MVELTKWYERVEVIKKKRQTAIESVEEGIILNREMLRSGKFTSDEEEIGACHDLAHLLQARKLFREMEE
jgi:hypothetical protein